MKQFFIGALVAAAVPTIVVAETDLFSGGKVIFQNQTCAIEHVIASELVQLLYIEHDLAAVVDLRGAVWVLINNADQFVFLDPSTQSAADLLDGIFDFLDETVISYGFSEGFLSLDYVVCT